MNLKTISYSEPLGYWWTIPLIQFNSIPFPALVGRSNGVDPWRWFRLWGGVNPKGTANAIGRYEWPHRGDDQLSSGGLRVPWNRFVGARIRKTRTI